MREGRTWGSAAAARWEARARAAAVRRCMGAPGWARSGRTGMDDARGWRTISIMQRMQPTIPEPSPGRHRRAAAWLPFLAGAGAPAAPRDGEVTRLVGEVTVHEFSVGWTHAWAVFVDDGIATSDVHDAAILAPPP